MSVAPSRDMSPAPSSPPPGEEFSPGPKETTRDAYVEVPGSSSSQVNGNGTANGGANGGANRAGVDEPMEVDDE